MCVAWLHSIPLGANVWIGLGNYHFFSRPNTWRVAIAMKMCYFQSNIVGKPQTGIRKSHSNNSQRSGANANQCASLTLICVNLLQKLELGCNVMLISPAVPSQSESKTLSRRKHFQKEANGKTWCMGRHSRELTTWMQAIIMSFFHYMSPRWHLRHCFFFFFYSSRSLFIVTRKFSRNATTHFETKDNTESVAWNMHLRKHMKCFAGVARAH